MAEAWNGEDVVCMRFVSQAFARGERRHALSILRERYGVAVGNLAFRTFAALQPPIRPQPRAAR